LRAFGIVPRSVLHRIGKVSEKNCRENQNTTLNFLNQNTTLQSLNQNTKLHSFKVATINGVTFEGVAEFIYLGTLISNDNSVEKEILGLFWKAIELILPL